MEFKNKDFLEQMLKDGNSVSDIAKKYNVHADTIRYYIRKYSIDKKIIKNKNKKYSFNENYFENIDTKNKAYILGVFASDGYLKDNRTVVFQFNEKDKELIDKIILDINYVGKIHYIEKKKQYALRLNSSKMYKDLVNIGFSNNKTFTSFIPKTFDMELTKHYIRGLFDGDGYIGERQAKLVTASEILKNQIIDFFKKEFNVELWNKKYNNTFHIVFNKKNRNLLFWLYDEADLFLERKKKSLYDNWIP